jgi:hypothetical protein
MLFGVHNDRAGRVFLVKGHDLARNRAGLRATIEFEVHFDEIDSGAANHIITRMGLAAGQGQYSGGQHGLDLFDHRRLPNFADFGPFGDQMV